MKKPPPLWTSLTDGLGKQWSWSRLTCTLILMFSLVWGTYIVWHEKRIPDFTSVALLIGAIYGVNRVAEWQETKPATPPQVEVVNPPSSPVPTQEMDKVVEKKSK